MTREEKRVHIIHSAIKVLSGHGLDGTKMELVAKKAGIGKGTIYEYFASKEQLFQEMIIYCVESYSRGLRENMDKGNGIEKKLLNYTSYSIDFFNKNLDMLLMVIQMNVFSQKMREQIIEQGLIISRYCGDMVAKARAQGELRSDLDPELASFLINGTIEQYTKQKVYCRKDSLNQPEQPDYRGLVDLMLRGLR
ncbi:MAG TPA: TetR/AcrR family transcriptional regulator [Desulfitobacteriaceae bacterium]|nr:TetR/AcrR family transcriptional regulator [Desulfitobacteriaceae bacterium]